MELILLGEHDAEPVRPKQPGCGPPARTWNLAPVRQPVMRCCGLRRPTGQQWHIEEIGAHPGPHWAMSLCGKVDAPAEDLEVLAFVGLPLRGQVPEGVCKACWGKLHDRGCRDSW